MSLFNDIITNLPEITKPTQKRLSFNEKLKWTGIILVIFYVLGMIPLYGLGANALQTFQFLSIILGAEFGSVISLGIGPIVTASIVLQLVVGSKLLKFDLTTSEGKKTFQGTQKLLSIFFIIFEAAVYVMLGGLRPAAGFGSSILIFQLFLGGMLILFMDEVVSKWGFGSGISLFIAAGVSKSIFMRLLSPFTTAGQLGFPFGSEPSGGKLWEMIYGLTTGSPQMALLAISAIVATVVVFVVAVYMQAMKVEIPLSFGRIRGHGIRWPLAFVYTSNIPVILVAALLANLQLWARLLENWGHPILGNPSTGTGIIGWISPAFANSSTAGGLIGLFIKQNLTYISILQGLTYVCFMIGGAVLFSIFWVQTSGMDARSQAKQMMSSGLQIPGFRRDERVLESLLNRYIMPLTVMGAIAVGFLAALADLSGALTNGTGLLLTVMIVYRLYEEIAQQHMMDMYPVMRRFIKQ
jgi:preprotein translocase subunit SecY